MKKKAHSKSSSASRKASSGRASTASFAQAVSTTSRGMASSTRKTSFTEMLTLFVSFLVANIVVVYATNLFFPMSLVLGNSALSPVMAALYSMVVLTVLTVGAMPVIELIGEQLKVKFTTLHWMAMYWVINFAALWLVSRFAEQLGLGISSWIVAVVVAAILDLVQGFIVTKAMK